MYFKLKNNNNVIFCRYLDVGDTNCAADTDPQLGYTSVFGLFLILLSGVLTAFLLFILEISTNRVKSILKNKKNEDAAEAVPQLVQLTEKENLTMELVKLREKIVEKEELIKRLQESMEEEKDGQMEIRVVEAED